MAWWAADGMVRRALRRSMYSDAMLATDGGYRLWLRRRHGVGLLCGRPRACVANTTLKSRQEWKQAAATAAALGLPRHPTAEKHWDSLAIVSDILDTQPRHARILDAGADLYSVILPWLFLYGYRDLIGVDRIFTHPRRRGPIRYQRGEITALDFNDGRFDAIVCQSVLEHGVPLAPFLAEASRLLARGGRLLISVDYFERPVDVTRIRAIDPDYFVFEPRDIQALLDTAAAFGLLPTSSVDLECREAAVQRRQFGLAYTFLMLTFEKRGA